MVVRGASAFALVTLVLGGCSSSPQTSPEDSGPPQGVLGFVTIDEGGNSGYAEVIDPNGLTDPVLVTITDETSWSSFWAVNTQFTAPPRPVPAVNFDQKTVLVVIDKRSLWAASIAAVEVESDTRRLIVRATRLTGFPWPVVSRPYHIVEVDGQGWDTYELEVTERDVGGNRAFGTEADVHVAHIVDSGLG